MTTLLRGSMMVRSARRLAKVWSATALIAISAPALAQDVAKPAKQKPSDAAQSKDGAASKKKDVSAALKAYDTGTRAYEQGKMDQAIQSLSSALSSGGLPSQQMAKALYYRGTAYRKQGKPAQAISDLTTAVWLKNGLSDSDRAQAIDQRQGAYREAGLGDAPPPVAQQKHADTPAPVAAAGSAAPPPPSITPGANVSVPGSSSLFSWFDFGGSGSPAPTPAPAPAAAPAPQPQAVAAAAPASDAVTSSWSTTAAAQSEPVTGAAPVSSLAPSPAPADPAPVAASAPAAEQVALNVAQSGEPATPQTPNALEKAGSAITGFFGNVFNGNSQAGAQATNTSSSPVLTSSTGADPATSAPAAVPRAEPAMPWSTSTAVAGKSQKQAALALPAAAAAPKGKYRLQVAAVRSRTEADQVAARIAAEHSTTLGARQALVDETVIGNMGTFYRVRVGPYADAQEPERLCGTLRPQGFDCLVVTQ